MVQPGWHGRIDRARNEVSRADAETLRPAWLVCDDFMLTSLPAEFDVVVGDSPHVRQERIPAPLLAEYRQRYRTLLERAARVLPCRSIKARWILLSSASFPCA